MSEKRLSDAGAVSFSERLASSQIFATLFRDGMALVEETATYLDGSGRNESKKLERSAAMVYATESMRLTTRLMQLASWLLLHRAVKEGEMTLAQASKEKSKVEARRLRSRRCKIDRALARKTAGADCTLGQAAGRGATSRRDHARVGAAPGRGGQSGRAAIGTAEGGLRAGWPLTSFRALAWTRHRRFGGSTRRSAGSRRDPRNA